jgi:hypothetical protein
MAQTITALFESHTAAYSAVQDLVDHGFERTTIGVMAQDNTSSDGTVTTRVATPGGPSGVAQGAGLGAALGGLGGLVVGLTALSVPGVGPVLAGGLLAAALTGAGVGAVTGGMVGALTEVGIPVELAMTLLSHHHPVDLHTRAEAWRRDGGSHVDLHEEV